MGMGEILIISFLFLTTLNCLVTYFCASSAMKFASKKNDYGGAVKKLRIYDNYILTTLTMLTGVVYVALSYNYALETLEESDYFITLATMGGFIFTLLTTFFSRLCYCYACNFILKTKLNEYECFMQNMFSLIRIFYPIFVVSFIIPTIYVLPLEVNLRHIIMVAFLFTFVFIYILSATFFNVLSLNAKRITDERLLNVLNKLFNEHKIKRYNLYYWDSSRSNDSNAMVCGLFKVNFFISTSLINSINDKELEAVVLHEIGHIKNNHIKSSIVNQMMLLFAIALVLSYMVIFNMINIYILLAIMLVFVLIVGLEIRITKKQEDEADLYVARYGLGEELISALRKISYDGEEDLIHGSVDKRNENIKR